MTSTLPVKNPVLRWILIHDDNLWFNVLYIGLALILSIVLGLFWLVAVVAIHWCIELARQLLMGRRLFSGILETFWELKLDISLIIFALWLGVYLDVIFGVAGLSAASRATAQAGGRLARTGTSVAIWQRIIRSVLISLDDLGLAMKAISRKKKGGNDNQTRNSGDADVDPALLGDDDVIKQGIEKTSWSRKYSKGDWFSLAFGGGFLMLIVLAPVITEIDYGNIWLSIREDLKPFP